MEAYGSRKSIETWFTTRLPRLIDDIPAQCRGRDDVPGDFFSLLKQEDKYFFCSKSVSKSESESSPKQEDAADRRFFYEAAFVWVDNERPSSDG